jgi:hypothetical protein
MNSDGFFEVPKEIPERDRFSFVIIDEKGRFVAFIPFGC